jgi:hypothetical protein
MSGKDFIAEIPAPTNRPAMCRILALPDDTWPERVIAVDLLYEELGDGGAHLVAEASEPIRMYRAGVAA